MEKSDENFGSLCLKFNELAQIHGGSGSSGHLAFPARMFLDHQQWPLLIPQQPHLRSRYFGRKS